MAASAAARPSPAASPPRRNAPTTRAACPRRSPPARRSGQPQSPVVRSHSSRCAACRDHARRSRRMTPPALAPRSRRPARSPREYRGNARNRRRCARRSSARRAASRPHQGRRRRDHGSASAPPAHTPLPECVLTRRHRSRARWATTLPRRQTPRRPTSHLACGWGPTDCACGQSASVRSSARCQTLARRCAPP